MLSFLGIIYYLRATTGERKHLGERRAGENQKRACCYRQLLCAAAAAGERPRRSCASI